MDENEKKHPWYAIDLDGTLAEYHGHKGLHIVGEPVPRMVERVKKMLAEGKDVRIFTARIGKKALEINPDVQKWQVVEGIQAWCKEHIGEKLPVTNEKDYGMVEIWDDRCVQVIPNTGERINQDSHRANYMICSVCKEKQKTKSRINRSLRNTRMKS